MVAVLLLSIHIRIRWQIDLLNERLPPVLVAPILLMEPSLSPSYLIYSLQHNPRRQQALAWLQLHLLDLSIIKMWKHILLVLMQHQRRPNLRIYLQVLTHLNEDQGALLHKNINQDDGKDADKNSGESNEVHRLSST